MKGFQAFEAFFEQKFSFDSLTPKSFVLHKHELFEYKKGLKITLKK